MKRRSFLQYSVSFLGGTYLTNDNVGVSFAGDYDAKISKNENSVIFLFLGGGSTHIETFNPIPEAPIERRSVTGAVKTNVNGIQIGGLFEKLATKSDKIAIYHGFHHKDSNHQTATHWVVDGEKNQGGTMQKAPSYGALVAGYYGPISQPNGLPTYIKMNKIDGDGPAWMGQKFMGYEANAQGVSDLQLKMHKDRFLFRKEILSKIENFSQIQRIKSGVGWVDLQNQAADAIMGKAGASFRIQEDAEFEIFKDDGLGRDMLSGMRAIENGAKFVNIEFGGWDMHGDITGGLRSRQTVLDKYLALLIDALERRGLNKNVMLVVASEFGRTPKLNATAGRDHWSGSVPLMISCAGYEMGRIIGRTNNNAEFPEDGLCTPEDLKWTILSHMGLQRGNAWVATDGRPMPVTGNEEKNILTDIA